MKGRRHTLSEEEWRLWAHVTESVKPLPGRKRAIAPPAAPAAEVAVAPAKVAALPAVQPPTTRLPPLAPLERRTRQRVQRGQSPIDGVLDLHGMRQDEAHRALLSFVNAHHRQGSSILLVVTGKGGRGWASSGDPERGVLRRLVPHWLADPSIRRAVIGFEDAGRSHGGEGALYVRIRRLRDER
jgi:DNA-nicking Smr family endonuclease